MKIGNVAKVVLAGFFVVVSAGRLYAASASAAPEKKSSIEAVKSELEDGLGLSKEQKEKVKAVRDEFKSRQQSLKAELTAKNEALRLELDGDEPVRSKVDLVVAEIKGIQGQMIDNRIDVVFKLRSIYTPEQIKLIKERYQQHMKEMSTKKPVKKAKKADAK